MSEQWQFTLLNCSTTAVLILHLLLPFDILVSMSEPLVAILEVCGLIFYMNER